MIKKNNFQKIGASSFVRTTVLSWVKFKLNLYGLRSRLKTGALFPQYINNDCYISHTAEIKYPERVTLGSSVRVGSACVLGAMGGIHLGDNVRLSKGVVLETAGLDMSKSLPSVHIAKPIIINNGVWIGTNAIVLGGVTIGCNSVIGAGAIVTKDVPNDMVYAGNPARSLKKRVD